MRLKKSNNSFSIQNAPVVNEERSIEQLKKMLEKEKLTNERLTSYILHLEAELAQRKEGVVTSTSQTTRKFNDHMLYDEERKLISTPNTSDGYRVYLIIT
jgi:hypothetical protein